MFQTVNITGVSSGLGLGLAKFYLEKGAEVFGCSRREPEEIKDHPRFHFQHADLSQLDTISEQLDSWIEKASRTELLILNAGILSPYGDMQETSLKDCQHVMDVNVWSNKQLLDAVLPRFKQLKQVAVISSGAAVNGNRGWNAYSISKAALNMLVQLYAREAEQAHFVSIAPGLIATAMQDYLCELPADDRFPALQTLKDRRGTDQMPTGEQLAPRIAQVIQDAPTQIESGTFIDIRKIDW